MAQLAKVLGIPTIATNQTKFGPIDPQVSSHHGDQVFKHEKHLYSMLDETVSKHFDSLGRRQVVLYGIETQVCIRQTALDLLEKDIEVYLLVDAVSSMHWHDRAIALRGLREAGVKMTSFQAMAFEMIRTVDHPKFKEILAVVKQSPSVHLDWDMTDAKL